MSAKSTDRIIFLDVDGPLIPNSMFLVDPLASIKRLFPVTTIAVLNKIIKTTNAKIVMNTTHNKPYDNQTEDIVDALIRNGVPHESFHAVPKTQFPAYDRLASIRLWLADHGSINDEEWIVLDDVTFHHRVIYIDPDTGLTLKHLDLVCHKFHIDPPVILI